MTDMDSCVRLNMTDVNSFVFSKKKMKKSEDVYAGEASDYRRRGVGSQLTSPLRFF